MKNKLLFLLLAVLIVFFIVLYNLNGAISSGTLVESVGISIKFDNSDLLKKVRIFKISPINNERELFINENGIYFFDDGYLNKIRIVFYEKSFDALTSVEVKVGSLKYFYNINDFKKKWTKIESSENVVFESPKEIKGKSSKISKINSQINNWIGDSNLIFLIFQSIPVVFFILFVFYLFFFNPGFFFKKEFMIFDNKFNKIFLFLSLISPFIFVFFVKNFHGYDVEVFDRWAKIWGINPFEIYSKSDSNYPFLGNVVSSGIMSVLQHFIDNSALRFELFRLSLAVFDSLMILMIYVLFKYFKINYSEIWTFLIALLPSTWAGSAVWGQIDGVGQLLFLLTLFFQLITLNEIFKIGLNKKCFIFFLLSSIGISSIILCKQLLLFGLVPIIILYFIIIILMIFRNKSKGIIFSASGIILIGLIVFIIDLFLTIPPPYKSHLFYIWFGGGSSHGYAISANGFNIWTFISTNMQVLSTIPFSGILNPNSLGTSLYGLYFLFLIAFIILNKKKVIIDFFVSIKENKYEKYVSLLFGCFLLVFSLLQLAMNVLLSGTHERYLYHFFPFAFLSLLILKKENQNIENKSFIFLLISGICYGLFVYGINSQLPGYFFIVKNQLFLASYHFFLLVYMSNMFIKIIKEVNPQ
jgi:hypothetical protein